MVGFPLAPDQKIQWLVSLAKGLLRSLGRLILDRLLLLKVRLFFAERDKDESSPVNAIPLAGGSLPPVESLKSLP